MVSRVGEWAHLHELGLADAPQLLRAVRLVHGVTLREHGLDDVVAAAVDVVGDVLREVDLLLEAGVGLFVDEPQVPQVVVLREQRRARALAVPPAPTAAGGAAAVQRVRHDTHPIPNRAPTPPHPHERGGQRTGSTMGMSGSSASSGVSWASHASMAPFASYAMAVL